MARASWFDAKRGRPLIEEQLYQLRGYMEALADGEIDSEELARQEQRVVAAMRDLEPALDDALHARVTEVLREMAAYNIMRILHEIRRQREAAERR
jgi:hypothetical protein